MRFTRHPASPPLQGEFYEALCKDVDPVAKELVCCFPEDAGLDTACFKLSYDVLVVAVGAGACARVFAGKGVLGCGGRGPRAAGSCLRIADDVLDRIGLCGRCVKILHWVFPGGRQGLVVGLTRARGADGGAEACAGLPPSRQLTRADLTLRNCSARRWAL